MQGGVCVGGGGGGTGAPTAMNQLWGGPACKRLRTPAVGRLIAVSDQAYHRCVISKFDDDVGAVCGCTVMCVQEVQQWAEDTALRSTSVEDQGR